MLKIQNFIYIRINELFSYFYFIKKLSKLLSNHHARHRKNTPSLRTARLQPQFLYQKIRVPSVPQSTLKRIAIRLRCCQPTLGTSRKRWFICTRDKSRRNMQNYWRGTKYSQKQNIRSRWLNQGPLKGKTTCP